MANDIERPRKLAVLIDAENTSPQIAAGLFDEIATIGEASVRRIYGDFSGSRLKGWVEVLSTHAIMPHHNIASVAGKNASDIALVIDAMDLLHSGRFNGFCLVSSDSDFTRLAVRIREQGLEVFGFGAKKTPESFRQACKRFIYTENLLPMAQQALEGASALQGASPPDVTPIKLAPKKAVPLIKKAMSQMEDADGWYHLGQFGQRLNALMSDFDPRNYGCAKLVTLFEKTGSFDVRREQQVVYVRPKKPHG
jgi:uncharacterized LabA/DUF88 family protein